MRLSVSALCHAPRRGGGAMAEVIILLFFFPKNSKILVDHPCYVSGSRFSAFSQNFSNVLERQKVAHRNRPRDKASVG